MEILIVYDSNYGNTRRIADHLAKQFGDRASAISVNDIKHSDALQARLLIVGSPINAWRPTQKIVDFLAKLDSLSNKKAAAFDTRVDSFISGNAAKKIARALEKAGATIVAKSIGFYVEGKEGPLKKGELERADTWAQTVLSKI